MAGFKLAGLLALLSTAAAYVPRSRNGAVDSTSSIVSGLAKRADDPSDFSWVKRWAAIGDSYTAGIGSGNPMGRIFDEELEITLPNGTISGHGDWYCSRYDMSYPMIVDRSLGGHVDDFQFLACSGDRSQQIFQQAQHLKPNLDMVILTAGGNDLCLAGIIKSCILMPYFSSGACETVINKAQENIDTILKGNVKQILNELNSKMAEKSIVVYNGYAQFFNTDTDNCENEAWDALWFIPGRNLVALRVTLARRRRFNELVIGINGLIRSAVEEVSADPNIKYKIGFSNWDPWVYEGVDGQMCSPRSNGDYPDPNQPDMQFIKPDTHPWGGWHDELRKRELNENEKRVVANLEARLEARAKFEEANLYNSLLFKSPAPGAEVLHKLDSRAPSPPNCPGDDSRDITFGLGMPDSVGKNFHPNENGHLTIASFAIATAMDLRAKVLGVEAPVCELTDRFTCWSGTGSKGYAMADRMNENYVDFCNSVKQPDHTTGWRYDKSYHEGSPDEHAFHLELGQAGDFNKDECIDSFKRIIHGCDTNSPMNWKFGGQYKRGEYTYEINVKRNNRPWPPPSKAVGTCKGWYKVFFGSYEIEGGGFSTWDWGQKSMRPNMDSCYGLGTTAWKFDYYDSPTKEGYEWKATFKTPIWVRARCFKNNKVVMGAGGFTDGCGGND